MAGLVGCTPALGVPAAVAAMIGWSPALGVQVCRRAERSLVTLLRQEGEEPSASLLSVSAHPTRRLGVVQPATAAAA